MTNGARQIRRIGFVSTRICGTDGVSLEIGKWATILERLGHECFFVCGKSDRPADRVFLIEEADFHHPDIHAINREAFGHESRTRDLSRRTRRLTDHLKNRLCEAIDHFGLDLLIAENALTIPLNIPLGAALVETLIETGIPCIAHHHDFAWERERFYTNAVDDYLRAAFPPRLARIEHVVINSLAGEEFSRRTGQPYRIIPNVMDFAHPPPPDDEYGSDFRRNIGMEEDAPLILQPTRVVARKGIEHSIELVRRLNLPGCKLVITHSANDEGGSYLQRVRDYADLLDVDIVWADAWVSHARRTHDSGRKQYAIWDVYRQADLVTYPSTYEGFGNAFLEAIYYKRPILCNRYPIFRTDIEPCGFSAITMDGFLTEEVVNHVRRVFRDDVYRQQMVDRSYDSAARFFCFERVEEELRSILRKPRWFARC